MITNIWKHCYLHIKCCPINSLAALMWRWYLNNKQAALQLRVKGSRRGQRNSPHPTHTWMEKRIQKPQYITWKGMQGKGDEKREKRAKCWKKTTIKRESSILLIILLGHIRICFLYLCMNNSFPLTPSTKIFSLYSD